MQTDIAVSDTELQTGFCHLTTGHNFLLVNADRSQQQAIVFIPPFAEEMNKSRHIISATMRKLNAAGYSCYLLDNYGTGDSEGDLDSATMTIWRDDLQQLLTLLAKRGIRNVSFIAIRFGTLQLFDLLNQYELPLPLGRVVLWQPFFDLAKFWQQFARIKVAEAMASGSKLSQKQLELQLEQAQTIEIAGYPISPAFYHSLLQANTAFPSQLSDAALYWLETSQLESVAVPVEKMRQQLQSLCQLKFHQLKDEPYWQTTELADATHLQALTLAYFTQDAVA